MEDSQADTTPLNVEHQATEQETVASKVEDEGSPCMYFQAQGIADVTTEEDKRSVEIVETPGTEDHRSSTEGVEHEDMSRDKKDESVGLPENSHSESQEISTDNKEEVLTEVHGSSSEPRVKSEEEAISEKHPESTELQGESPQVIEDAAEKKMEINLVEESVQQDITAKQEEVLEHGEGETCTLSISEDQHSKDDNHGNQEDLPSQSNISEASETNSAAPAEEVLTARHESTEIPVINVEPVVATKAHHIESSSSDTKDAPDCQNDHHESLHPAESTEAKPLEVSEHGSLTAAQQDPVKAANDLEEANTSEEQGSGETAEIKNEECSECHKDQHTHEAKEDKEVLGL